MTTTEQRYSTLNIIHHSRTTVAVAAFASDKVIPAVVMIMPADQCLRVDVSMMLMCYTTAIVEYDRRRSSLFNAPLNKIPAE